MAKRAEQEAMSKTWIFSVACALLLSGCTLPLAGGKAGFESGTGARGAVQQPENPKDEAQQTWEREQRADGSVSEKITTVVGAAQKDMAREVAAKLSSMRWITWLGVLVFLGGIASAFWPPLKLIVGSVTTSVIMAVAGLVLIVLPIVIVGNELLILGGAGGAVLFYWFAHRHSKASTEARVYKDLVDKNNDGIDDRLQNEQ